MNRLRGQWFRPARDASGGQSLAEFALVVPLFVLVLTGLMEFTFAFNALLNTNFASRGAGLRAAQAGNASAADCIILAEVELKMAPPTQEARIDRVDIQRTNPSGSTVFATTSYRRSGSTSCTLADSSTITVPYSSLSNGYPASQRCTVLPPNGCPTMTPVRTTVDTVAVQVTYDYRWITPLPAVFSLVGGSLSGQGMTIVQRNVFRMEPSL
jgi:hypothetical protein